MLNDIIKAFCLPTGYNPNQQRDVLLNYINRGAKDIYDMLEADSLMREVVLQVPRDQQVSLPAYIGEVRGLREYNWDGIISLNEIGSPRYSSDTWKFKWRNWRYKGKKALAQSIVNAGPLVFNVVGVETTPVQVIVTGRTAASHKISETVILTTTQTFSVNSYSEIDLSGIACLTTPRTYDIQVTDVNGRFLAYLYNNEATTDYIEIDVSAYPWMSLQGDGTNSFVEVLYKAKFYKMFNPTDTFQASGYDDAIAYRALVLWYQGKDEGAQNALLYAGLMKQVIDSNVNNDERGQVLKIAQGSNSTYKVFSRLRNTWGRRVSSGWWR